MDVSAKKTDSFGLNLYGDHYIYIPHCLSVIHTYTCICVLVIIKIEYERGKLLFTHVIRLKNTSK